MSNVPKATKKRKYPEIPSVRATPQDRASTQRTVGRLMGRVPLEVEQETPSLPETSSLPVAEPLAYQKSSLPESGSPPESGTQRANVIDLMASLPDVEGYTKLWHQMTDHLYRQLTTAEQAVHVQLFRLSWGYNKPTCFIALPKLAERVGIARSAVQRALDGLVAKGLVTKTRLQFGKGHPQGIEYTITPPPSLLKASRLPETSSLPEKGSNKEHTLKENTQTQPGVRVGSRFSLKECRQYADSLKSEGIQNPGGYATKIHRTGEADELIERFLSPLAPAPTVDASQCPDCQGSGWWYPKGKEKGIARCKHERLLATSS